MMKRYFLILLFGIAVLPAIGQGVTDYYQLPAKGPQYNSLLARYGGAQVRDRWYVALDGFVRTDRAQLDNSLNGLIESDLVGKAGWGVVVGWAYRERWMIEGGYARTPIHTQLSVSNANPPLSVRNTNVQNAFVFRTKRLIFSTSKPWLRSGFWLSGGMWVSPNISQQQNQLFVSGNRFAGRWESNESFQLESQTQTTTPLTTLAELGAEYNVRLTKDFDLGFSIRKLWGLSRSLTTDVTFTANRMAPMQTQLLGTGSGMTYGVTLRYTFLTHRNKTNVLDVQGKRFINRIQ